MPLMIPVGSPPSEISVGRTCPKPTAAAPKAPATPRVGAAVEAAVLVVVEAPVVVVEAARRAPVVDVVDAGTRGAARRGARRGSGGRRRAGAAARTGRHSAPEGDHETGRQTETRARRLMPPLSPGLGGHVRQVPRRAHLQLGPHRPVVRPGVGQHLARDRGATRPARGCGRSGCAGARRARCARRPRAASPA